MDMRLMNVVLFATILGWTATAAAAERAKLDEGQALGAAITANANEVMAGSAMAARAQDPEVRAYAMRLMEDHASANQALLNYQEQAGIKATDSRLRAKLLTDGTKMTEMLWSKDPSAMVDQRFLSDSITDHRELLRNLDEVLIPAAVNSPELTGLLTRQRATYAEHLRQGCMIGRRLGADTEQCPMEPGTR
ncbi:MAG: DUF4142 domain-containing protein [Pseudomonadota bacterium]|nr:DUF4142 domain-containing protein [Pseudomonadota bacterium]